VTGVRATGVVPKPNAVGSAVRACAGVDETLLSRCHWERARYTGLGGAVLGTASAAAFSMGLALATTTEHLGAGCVLAALGWGIFIFNIDRWMVSSTHGLRRKSALVPRFGLALVFGFIIAEPVVLTVFSSAIENHIADKRGQQAGAFEALLARCNPTNPSALPAVASADCRDARLNVNPPEGKTQQLTELGRRREVARQQLSRLQADLTETRKKLQREQAGQRGADTTGRYGRGTVAQALEVDVARLTRERDAAQNRFDTASAEYQKVAATTEGATTSYGERVSAAIEARVTEERAKLDRKPGLLERIDALHELTTEHAHLFIARWFLTLFFVLVDSMPVLVKMLSGTSTYDCLVHSRLAMGERVDRHALRLEEEGLFEEHDLDRLLQQQDAVIRREQIRLHTRQQLRELDDSAAAIEDLIPPTPRWEPLADPLGEADVADLATFLADDTVPESWLRRGTDAARRSVRKVVSLPDAIPEQHAGEGRHTVPNLRGAGEESAKSTYGSPATALLDEIRTFQIHGGWDEIDDS
jgi:hypothetical protein